MFIKLHHAAIEELIFLRSDKIIVVEARRNADGSRVWVTADRDIMISYDVTETPSQVIDEINIALKQSI